MMIDEELLDILACPECKTKVVLEGEMLRCPQCRRRYRIEEGKPIMLLEEALSPEESPAGEAPTGAGS